MNAIWAEGRRFTDVSSLCAHEYTSRRLLDAERGSKLLKDAILRAKGYKVPQTIVPPVAPFPQKLEAPKFRKRTVKKGPHKRKGRALGWRKERKHSPKIFRIIGLVAEHFQLTVDDITGSARHYEVSHPRQIAMFLARNTTALSLPDIGLHFARDHTTILHAVRAVEQRIAAKDETTIRALQFARSRIGA